MASHHPIEEARIAFVHDWLAVYAGAERVLEQMLAVYPHADLFALIDVLPDDKRAFLGGRRPHTSWLQRLPRIRTRYRGYLPLMPWAIRDFDLSGYDVVISSSHAVAKGARTTPSQLHLCMCYSPMRYAWDLQEQYLTETGLHGGVKGLVVRGVLSRMRSWDRRSAKRVDGFIAISQYIAERIRRAYDRESTVVYPPVDVDYFTPGTDSREPYYVTASRMVPYKRIDLIVEAFAAMPDRELVVIGDGPEAAKVRAKAGSNVRILGHQPREVLREHLRRARAFVFVAEEDFGIAPIEAQACGTPVIAYGAGALPETIRGLSDDRPTGVMIDAQSVVAIVDGVERFEAEMVRFTEPACRENATRFDTAVFQRCFDAYVRQRWSEWTTSGRTSA